MQGSFPGGVRLGLCPKPHPRTFLQKGSWESPKTFKKGIYLSGKDCKKWVNNFLNNIPFSLYLSK
jgi:hypothetical protein